MNQEKKSNQSIIEKYLNDINISEKYNENYKTFLNLISFLETIDNLDTDDKILIENDKLQELIQSIVSYNMVKIKNNKINEICKNKIAIRLIDTYCILNNIYEYDEQLSSKTDILNLHLKSIGKIPLLSKNEEIELFKKYYNGDENAKEILINSNLKLVVDVANRYNNKGVDLLDLIQDGNNKLIEIVDKFDLNKNCKFSTFAYNCLVREMDRSIAKNGRNIRISNNQYHKLQMYFAVKNEIEKKYNRIAEKEEIARELNCTIDELEEIEELQFDTYSLNNVVFENTHKKNVEFGDIIPDNDVNLYETYEKKALQDDLNKLLLSILNKRELFILKNRLEGIELERIAKKLGITRERVRQIERKAIVKIFKNKETDKFAIYTDNEEEALKNLEEKRKQLKKERKKNKK